MSVLLEFILSFSTLGGTPLLSLMLNLSKKLCILSVLHDLTTLFLTKLRQKVLKTTTPIFKIFNLYRF